MDYFIDLFSKGYYQPENSDQSYSPFDFIDAAKGNLRYAVLLRDRVEWQHPETLVDEDIAEGEVIEIEGQYVLTNGNTIEVSNAKDNE